MSFETSPFNTSPGTPANQPIATINGSEPSKVAAAMRAANITRNVERAPGVQLGTFSSEYKRPETSVEATKRYKKVISDLEMRLENILKNSNTKEKLGDLLSLSSEITKISEDNEVSAKQTFTDKSPGTPNAWNDFDRDLQEFHERLASEISNAGSNAEFSSAEAGRAEQEKIAREAVANTGSAMADAILRSGLNTKNLPKSPEATKKDDQPKVGGEIKAPTIKELDDKIQKLEGAHKSHLEATSKHNIKLEDLKNELEEVARENLNLKDVIHRQLTELQGIMNQKNNSHSENLAATENKVKELESRYSDLLSSLNHKIQEVYDRNQASRKPENRDVTYESQQKFFKERIKDLAELQGLFADLENAGQDSIKPKQIDKLNRLYDEFNYLYSKNSEFRIYLTSVDKNLDEWRVNNLNRINTFLNSHKQNVVLEDSTNIVKDTNDVIDPLKDGEGEPWAAYKAPGSGDIDLNEIPEGEKGITSSWANNGDGNDDPIEGGLHDIAPADSVIDGEFKVINEGEAVAAPTAPSTAKEEPEIKNTYFEEIDHFSKQETKVFEYKFNIDGQEYVINNLPDFVTFVKLQDNRILNKDFDPSTIANTNSGFAFKSTAVRAIKLEKLRAGIPVKLGEYDLKNLLKHSFKKYIEQLQQVKIDHETNPNMVAENMYKTAMDQTMYDFGNPTETATTTDTAEAPQAQEAGPTEGPATVPEKRVTTSPENEYLLTVFETLKATAEQLLIKDPNNVSAGEALDLNNIHNTFDYEYKKKMSREWVESNADIKLWLDLNVPRISSLIEAVKTKVGIKINEHTPLSRDEVERLKAEIADVYEKTGMGELEYLPLSELSKSKEIVGVMCLKLSTLVSLEMIDSDEFYDIINNLENHLSFIEYFEKKKDKSKRTHTLLAPSNNQLEIFTKVETAYPPTSTISTKDGLQFEFSKIYENIDPFIDRKICIMYYISHDGTKYPSLLYKSHSDGGWRSSLPSTKYSNAGSFFSKGEHYTRSAKLSEDIFMHLEEMETSPAFINSDPILPKNGRYGLLADINIGYLEHSTNPEISIHGNTVPKKIQGHDSLYARYSNGGSNDGQKNGIEDFNVDKDLIPNFSSPVKIYNITHTVIGPATVLVYEKEIDGKVFEFHIANPTAGLPWLNDITEKNGERTIYGTSKDVYDFGCLDMKPFDYGFQVPQDIKDFPGVERVGDYCDCRPFLVKTNFMTEYMNAVYKNGSADEYINKYKNAPNQPVSVSTPAPEQAPEAEPSIAPRTEEEIAKGLELQWDEEDHEYYANFNSDLHRITSNEIVDEGTIKAVKSKLEATLSQIETEEKGGAGTARFYYLKESINTYLELIKQKLSVTDSGAAAVDAVAKPAQNRNPFADEPELVTASPATVSGLEAVPEAAPATDQAVAPSEAATPTTRDFGSILDPIKFKDVEISPKLTQKEIDEFKAKFNLLIGSEWGPINPLSPYPIYVDKIIPGGLMDRANKGALTPEESKEAIERLEAIAAQIADWKGKGIVAGEFDDTIRTIEIVLNRIRSSEYDKVTKEAEIKSVEAEAERFKTSKEYSDAISLANNPISTFTSDTPALHTRLAEIEESIDILTQMESSIRAVDSKNKFLLELNKIINTLENRALDIEKAMPAKYAREMKEMSSGPINKAALVNDSERGIGRIDSISAELNAALNSLDDMIARPELTDAGIRIQIIAKKAEIDSALDRLSGIKDKFEKSQKAADKLSTQKVEANRLMSKLVSSLTIADNPDQINDNLAQLDRLIQTDGDYSELEALDPDHSVIKERAVLREKIEAYLTALGGRKVELEQQAKIEAFKTEIAAIESEMKAKFDELNDDMERVYAGVIPDMTTIPDEDSDETPLSADRRALLAQRWEEYRIGRMRWKTQAIALNDQFKGRLDALRSTIYSVRVPLNICKKFADTELAINKKFIDCKALEKVNPYVTPINKAMDIMIKRGIKFTKIDSFDQIKNGVKQGKLAKLLNLFRGR